MSAIGHVTAIAYSNGAAYTTQAKGFTTLGASIGETYTIPSNTTGTGGEAPALAGTYAFTHTYDTNVGLALPDTYPAFGTLTTGGLPAETVKHTYLAGLDLPNTVSGTISLKSYAYTAGMSYDAYGRIGQATLGTVTTGQATLTNAWDTHTGQLTRRTVGRSTALPSIVDDHTYTHDPVGNLTQETRTRLGATSTGETQRYTYDGVNRLTGAWTGTDSCAATPTTANHASVGDPQHGR